LGLKGVVARASSPICPAMSSRFFSALQDGGGVEVGGYLLYPRRLLVGVSLLLLLSYEFGFQSSRWRKTLDTQRQAGEVAVSHRTAFSACDRRAHVANIGYFASSVCSFNATKLADWSVVRLYYATRRSDKVDGKLPCTFFGVGASAFNTTAEYDRSRYRAEMQDQLRVNTKANARHRREITDMAREYVTRLNDAADVDNCNAVVYTWSGQQATVVEEELGRIASSSYAPNDLARRVTVRGTLGAFMEDSESAVKKLDAAVVEAAAPNVRTNEEKEQLMFAAQEKLELLRLGVNASYDSLEQDVRKQLQTVLSGPIDPGAYAASVVFKVSPSVSSIEMVAALGKATAAPVTRLVVWTEVRKSAAAAASSKLATKAVVEYFANVGYHVYVVGANTALERKSESSYATRLEALTFLRVDSGFFDDVYTSMSTEMQLTFAAIKRTDRFNAYVQRHLVTCSESVQVAGDEHNSIGSRMARFTGKSSISDEVTRCRCRLEELKLDRTSCDVVRAVAADDINLARVNLRG